MNREVAYRVNGIGSGSSALQTTGKLVREKNVGELALAVGSAEMKGKKKINGKYRGVGDVKE